MTPKKLFDLAGGKPRGTRFPPAIGGTSRCCRGTRREPRSARVSGEIAGLRVTERLERPWLRKNGIVTEVQLHDLVNSSEILDTLRQIYVEELKRDPDKPLDPMALATWGAYIYTYGKRDDVIRAVRLMIRKSPEYRGKHSS